MFQKKCFYPVKKAVEVDMHSIPSSGVKEDVLTMAIT